MEHMTAHAVKKLYSFDVHSSCLSWRSWLILQKGQMQDNEMENYRSGLKFLFLRIHKRYLPVSSSTDLKTFPSTPDQVKTIRDLLL